MRDGRCAPSASACCSASPLYDAYLIAPPAGGLALLTALLAVAGIGLALVGIFFSGVTTLDFLREPADVR